MDLLPQHHDLSVTTIAERLHVSESKLRRVSLRHFGFPIKVLLRRSRFMKSLVSIYGQEPGNWAKLIDPSYHDQSHFIKDFRYFMGISPTEFFSRPSPMTQLSMRARKDLLGAAVAALHKTRE
jgi:AraC-like DNA-binding protein